jgi:16S rRNA G1207 methylase RsmC
MRAVSADPSTVLAVEEIPVTVADQVAILHSTDPALALHFGKTAAHTDVYDYSLSSLEKIHQQAEARKVERLTVHDTVFPDTPASYDIVILTVPKGRDYGRALLYAARKTLKPGGRCYVVGPTDSGAKSLIEDMGTLFGSSATLTYRKRNRIGVSIQPETPASFPEGWGVDPTQMVLKRIGKRDLWTIPGVFSWDQLDDGTAFLLDHVEPVAGERVLDVGCGNGIIGLTMIERGAGYATLVDDSLLAVGCARRNAAGLANVEVLASDIYSAVAGQQFDLIISNPPFHQKFDVNTNVAHRIMREALQCLAPGGRLIIVANAFLKYTETLTEHLERVRELARNGRYVVLEGRRPTKGDVKPSGVRGSKRRAEQDEAELFRKEGVLPPIREAALDEAKAEDEELEALFDELDALESGAFEDDEFDELDNYEDFFDDEEDDDV